MVTVYTIGHSNRSLSFFLDVLGAHSIHALVDIRSWPSSRRHPHFQKDALAQALGRASVSYAWERPLGGRRVPQPGPTIHTAIDEPVFRAYVDHLHSGEASEAIERLIGTGREKRTAVMCAERDPYRCHRRFLADRLVALGLAEVVHVLDLDDAAEHELHPALVVEGDRLVYETPQQSLLP